MTATREQPVPRTGDEPELEQAIAQAHQRVDAARARLEQLEIERRRLTAERDALAIANTNAALRSGTLGSAVVFGLMAGVVFGLMALGAGVLSLLGGL